MKKVVDNGAKEAQTELQQKKINLLSSAQEIQEKYGAVRQELLSRKYKLIYETEQHPDDEFGYKEDGAEEKYFTALLGFVKTEIPWKGYGFMEIDAVYSALNQTISEKTYEIPAYVLETLLKQFETMEGVGHDSILQRIYLLKPINHTFGKYKEDEEQLKELENMYNTIQAQLHDVEQQLSENESTKTN